MKIPRQYNFVCRIGWASTEFYRFHFMHVDWFANKAQILPHFTISSVSRTTRRIIFVTLDKSK